MTRSLTPASLGDAMVTEDEVILEGVFRIKSSEGFRNLNSSLPFIIYLCLDLGKVVGDYFIHTLILASLPHPHIFPKLIPKTLSVCDTCY